MELTDKIKRKREALLIAVDTTQWCAAHIGYGRKKYIPELFVERWNSTDYDKDETGYYSDYELHIAYDKVGTVEGLIRTIIHEWTHYTQTHNKVRYAEGVDYREQVCEVEAFKNEEVLYPACWANIITKI